uniref:Uncharacterized protein n=1 Tax=Cyprinus carpio TaxID=7962 RepID=A0A8C1WWH2_CYPCA
QNYFKVLQDLLLTNRMHNISYFKKGFSLQAVYHNLKPAALRQQLENLSVRSERVEVWASAAPEVLEKSRLGIFAPNKESSCSVLHVHMNLSPISAQSDPGKTFRRAPHAVLSLGLGTEDDTEDVFVEFSHQDLLDFYNQVRLSPSDP